MAIRVGTQPILSFKVGGAIAPSWTPLDFTDIKYYWTADDLSTSTLSGGDVVVWKDIVSGQDMIRNASYGAPTTGSSATLNSQPILSFNGTSDFLYTDWQPASWTGDKTWLAVYNLVGSGTSGVIFGWCAIIGGVQRLYHDTFGGNLRMYSEVFSSATATNMEVPFSTGATAWKARYNASSGQVYYAVDTTTETLSASGGTTNSEWGIYSSFCVGATMNSRSNPTPYGGRYVPIEMAECMIINGSPSPTEMGEWTTYVNNKYGTIIV